jgi:intracellular sulfur oxidation DsrE/DsrF family protein
MRHDCPRPPVARRSMLLRLSAVVGALGFGSSAGRAQTQVSPAAAPPSTVPIGRWQPARHALDDWLDEIPGKHRFFFDSTTPGGARDAMMFASNYFVANKNAYGLDDADLAVVVGLRHHSTPFAFNDAMWAKYGAGIAERIAFDDPKTSQPPTANVYGAEAAGLLKHGVRFAVCDMATHALAGVVARKIDGNADSIYKDLVANTVGGCHFVPAGIVGVNRAQERGYSIAHTG